MAAVIRAYAEKNEPLEGERARLRSDVLRDFRRNGLGLAPEDQRRLRALSEEITKIGQEFLSNINASTVVSTLRDKIKLSLGSAALL